MDKSRGKLWTRDFIIISTTNFFVFLSFYLLMTTLTLYAIEEFKAAESMAGFASSIFVIGALVSRLFAGKYIERIGRRKLLLGGLVLFLLATLLYFLADSMNFLLLVRFFHGAAFGIASTAIPTIVMSIIPDERRGEGTSYFAMSNTLATAIGPFLGILISQRADSSMIFVVSTAFAVTSIIISLFVKVPEVKLTKEQLRALRGFSLKEFFEIKAIPIAVIAALMGFTYSSILSFLSSYAIKINMETAASFFFVVYAVFILISRPFSGRLMDPKGDNIVIFPAMALFAVGMVTLSQAHAGFVLLIAAALIGLGYGTMTSATQAIAVKESPKHRVALATSTFFIFVDGGVGVGPYILGALIPLLGFRGLYLALAGLVFVSILLYYLLHGKKEFKRRVSQREIEV